jgi:hypothetical protein
MDFPLSRWLKFSFLNLALIALIGVIMRYKIAYSFPFLDQKHLMQGHSHFAFAGWVTHTLMALLVQAIAKNNANFNHRKYRFLLYANLITAYGMLVSFPVSGYGFLSIVFSTLSIFVSYGFAIVCWKDFKRTVFPVSYLSFRAAIIFNAISSLGPFTLAFMMATRNTHQGWYLASVYYFLHFQYNGWFFFAILGLVFSRIEHFVFLRAKLLRISRYFLWTCVPAFFLSALWLPIPVWLYWLVVAAAFLQLIAWLLFLKLARSNKQQLLLAFPQPGRGILLLAALALSIKLLLQLGSTIPSLSQLAFGFRPIVIGYLHLVLLGVVSIFLIGYVISFRLIQIDKKLLSAAFVFIAGVVLNEFLLLVQGVASLNYLAIPYISEGLFVTAVVLFAGALRMYLQTKKNIAERDPDHNLPITTGRPL